MDWSNIIVAAVSGTALVWVAIIQTKGRKDRERTEKRAARRAEESRLSMRMQSAGLKLALITAKTVRNQKTNGDVEEAMDAAETVQAAYDDFIRSQAAEQVTKI